ncbi:MAG: TonB family protein [Gemmatimonadota bacterium]|nr:TonB family protein [Gemmatimonadota bacterium]
MFTQLLASRPARQRSAPQVAASVAFHGALIAGVALGTSVAPRVHATPVEVPIYVPTSPSPAPPTRPRPPASPAPPVDQIPPVNLRFSAVPTSLPPITTSPIGPPPVPAGSFAPGPFLLAPPTVPRSHAPGTAYLAAEVEQEVAIEGGSPMPRYPSALRSAGVEGTARVRFVVDTLGRVEPATVETITATNGMFEMAVRDALPRMRFRPARVGGHAVRQLVEFPVAFRLSK